MAHTMRYALVETRKGIMLMQIENDPEKVFDMMLDEYNLCEDPERKQKIKEAMEMHAKRPTIFIDKKEKPIPYDPNLHSNLVKDGAIIGQRLL